MTDKEKISYLQSEVIELKKQLSVALATIDRLSIKKTSKNSSVPPSHDIEKTKSLRTKSKKTSGGQPGHKGSNLKMVSNPEVVEELKPDFCSNCGQAIKAEDLVLRAKRQVIDIVLSQPITTEYQQYKAICSCGHTTIADFPVDVKANIQYGKNVEALVEGFA